MPTYLNQHQYQQLKITFETYSKKTDEAIAENLDIPISKVSMIRQGKGSFDDLLKLHDIDIFDKPDQPKPLSFDLSQLVQLLYYNDKLYDLPYLSKLTGLSMATISTAKANNTPLYQLLNNENNTTKARRQQANT